jgi:hypothetical protein
MMLPALAWHGKEGVLECWAAGWHRLSPQKKNPKRASSLKSYTL